MNAKAARGLLRRWGILLAAVGVVVALLLPAFTSTYAIRLVTGIFMFGALACGWNLIGGYAGYADFGAASFLGIGAYTTGILMTEAKVPFALAVFAGGGMAMVAATGMGALLLRLRGH